MHPSELLSRYRAGERDFSGIDLSNTDFYRCAEPRDLRGVILSGANLSETEFSNVNLKGADLSEANLTDTKFYRCNLDKVNFRNAEMKRVQSHCNSMLGANLTGANLQYAYLSSADLSHANLMGADLTKSDLRRTKLCHANLQNTVLDGAELSADNSSYGEAFLNHANLSGVDFKGISLSRIDLSYTNLSRANLSQVNLASANLSQADLSFANLENADFGSWFVQRGGRITSFSTTNPYRSRYAGANLTNANLRGANLSGANLSDTNLDGANFCDAVLENVNFTRANLNNLRIDDLEKLSSKERLVIQLLTPEGSKIDLQGVDLNGTYLDNIDFSDKDLSHTSFEEASLCHANFQNTDLHKSNFNHANLSHADFQDTNLSQATLTHSNLDRANLSRSNLQQTEFRYANLVLANLTDANLKESDLSEANLASANFTHASVDQANLSYANLFRTKLIEVSLATTALTGAKLFHANLSQTLDVPASVLSLQVPHNSSQLELVNSMKAAASELRHRSETDHPYEIFLWDVETKGEFTLEQLLIKMNYLRPLQLADFWSDLPQHNLNDTQRLALAYQALMKQIGPHLKNIEFFKLSTEDLRDTSSVMLYILLGQTDTDDWVGITTSVTYGQQARSSLTFLTQDTAMSKPQNSNLVTILSTTITEIEALLPESEATGRIIWEIAEQRDAMFQNLLMSSKHLTIAEYPDYFFQEGEDYAYSDNEDELKQRQKLAHLVKTYLKDLRLYRIGGCNIDFYVMGQAQSQDWIGVRTEVTWT